MKALDIIPQMNGDDTIDEEVLEDVDFFVAETEIDYEIFFYQKKDKTEFDIEKDNYRNHIKVDFGYDVSHVSDKHFNIKISPDIRNDTKTEDIQSTMTHSEI